MSKFLETVKVVVTDAEECVAKKIGDKTEHKVFAKTIVAAAIISEHLARISFIYILVKHFKNKRA